MYKKLVSLLVIAVLLLTFAGCGQSSESSKPEAGSQAQKSDSATSSQEKTSEEEIKIGFYGPLSGSASVQGIPSERGAIIAVEEINSRGGIDGKKVKLISYDDKSSTELAVKNVTRLIEVDKVHAIIGSLHSANILATAPIIEEKQVPEMGTGTGAAWTQMGYKYIFRANPRADYYNKETVDAMKKLGVKTLATLNSQTEYAKATVEDLINQLKEAGGIEVVVSESHHPGDTDFTGQLTKMINSGAEAFYVVGGPEEISLHVKQARKLGFNGWIFGVEGFTSPDIIKIAGDAANNIIYGAADVIPEKPEDGVNEVERKFLKVYFEKYGEMPSSDCAYRSYDAMMLLELAIKNAKSLSGPDIRDGILKISEYNGIAGKFDFTNSTGDGIFSARKYIIKDGKNVLLTDEMLESLAKEGLAK